MLIRELINKQILMFLLISSFVVSDDLFKIVSNDINSKIEIKNQNVNILKFINDLELNQGSAPPSYSTFYQVDNNYDIRVEFNGLKNIVTSSKINNASNLNESNISFHENHLVVSEPMVFRGINVKQIIFYPFGYDEQTNEFYFYEDVELIIEEYQTNQTRNYIEVKTSKLFESFYKDLIINYEVSNREENYQKPSILYICGGSSLDNSYVQELIDWRHKLGYVVNAISTGDIPGSGSSSIKNYIQNAYQDWDNPPELVGLIGDTSGSYAIDYFIDSWSGYNGAGDFPYSQLDGPDLLPEVFVGRISVNSASDLNNVINKTLAYEKATYIDQIGNDWYERAALCGDPSSSGQSTIITNQYIENVMQSYAFEDVNTNYGNGGYSNWMENQLENGSLYMNYRGYIGVSGFTSSNINAANNGYKTPFATFLTCGTGDFNYTSLSEEFFRAGSVNNPKGAVAAVGTATSGTHTMFNNIVGMGIYDGIFSKNLKTAGAVVGNGRLSLLYTYPADPNNKVSIFSYWNNLIGDPALTLWTDTPKFIQAEYQENIPYGTNFIDVHVQDDMGFPIENALVTLLKGDDEIFVSELSDAYGNVTLEFDYESIGNVYVTITKQNCIPIEESFNIVQEDINVNIIHENIQLIDIVGNSDGVANPGETLELIIPVINHGSSIAYNVSAELSSENELINILNGETEYGNINPSNISSGQLNYSIELDEQIISSDMLIFKINIWTIFTGSY